jgi:thiol-disulfide isomerase/thioredoxin
MMRFLSFLAFKLGAVALVLTSPAAPRLICPGHAVAAQGQRTPNSAVQTKDKATTDGQQAAAVAAPSTTSLTVREMDLAALKELLQRDPKKPRPLLINFWATWCDPCREEFPDLVRMDTDYRARGLELVTISLDDVTEINGNVPQFLKEMNATMPAYLLNVLEPGDAIALIDKAWRGALPATFLYDARGQIVFRHTGRIKPAELRAAIEKVLSEK